MSKKLDKLIERVEKLIERVETLQDENSTIKKENRKIRSELMALQKDKKSLMLSATDQSDTVKTKLTRILNRLDQLEELAS